jgi:hypothetical protein
MSWRSWWTSASYALSVSGSLAGSWQNADAAQNTNMNSPVFCI